MILRAKIGWLLVAALLLTAGEAAAQLPRSERVIVRGGVQPQPDSLTRGTDSFGLRVQDSLVREGAARGGSSLDSLAQMVRATDVDSLLEVVLAADSLPYDYPADSLPAVDSAELAAVRSGADSLAGTLLPVAPDSTRRRGNWLLPDSMSLSKVCWIAAVLPGYGQAYNKQYWKMPILYGTLGTSLGLFFHENNRYKPLKRQYDAITLESTDRTRELDLLQGRMIRSNTRRQLYLGAAIASYIYFIGDAAVNYSTNDVSNVKKATTLACICPGAGQIFNKSYWKVPFVVGGFASMIYCVDWNNRGYQRFKKAYRLRSDYDRQLEEHNANPEVPAPDSSKDEFRGRYSASFLKDLKDSYRRNRDLCIIVTAGLYVLQIIDAHVDAHLKDYDISDDLSMNIEPTVDYKYIPSSGGNRPVYGFNLSINF